MNYKLTIPGGITSGLSHFALAGLSLIARSITDQRVVTYWSQDPTPKGTLEMEDVTLNQLAQQIQQTAKRWSEGWCSARVTNSGGEFSPFSPRFKKIDSTKHPEDWADYQNTRVKHLDCLFQQGDHLALQFIESLGEAAYWNAPDDDPDKGASRLDMVTRNAGKEFVKTKVYDFTTELAGWENADILAGITGKKICDPNAKGKSLSRTPSGFTPPGTTDLALAFAALIGIGQFAISHRKQGLSITPICYPASSSSPKFAMLPISTSGMTPERFESVVLSAEWAAAIAELGLLFSSNSGFRILSAETSTTLKQLGLTAVAVFRIHYTPVKVPERYFEKGMVQLL